MAASEFRVRTFHGPPSVPTARVDGIADLEAPEARELCEDIVESQLRELALMQREL